MRCLQRRFVLSAALALSLAVLAAPTAHAGLTQSTSYDHLFNQVGPILVDEAHTGGQWVWIANYSGGFGGQLLGFDPGGGVFQTTMTPQYFDPSGEIGPVSDIAYYATTSSLYVADPDNNRLLRFLRTYAIPGSESVYYADDGGTVGIDETPLQAPGPVNDGGYGPAAGNGQFSVNGPSGIDKGFTQAGVHIVAADPTNVRVQIFDGDLNFQSQFTHPDWVAGVNEPVDVMVGPTVQEIYVRTSSGNTIYHFDDLGENELTPLTTSAPPVDMAADISRELIYVATATQVEVFSSETGNYVGAFEASDFGSNPILAIDANPADHGLYVSHANNVNLGYNIDSGPICDPVDPVTVTAGESVVITPTCTDVDGAPFVDVVPEGTEGTYDKGTGEFGPTPESFTYVADSDKLGSDNATFRVRTKNGKSNLESVDVEITAAPTLPPAPPPTTAAEQPTFRIDSNLSKSTGDILIRLPGTNTFVPLEKDAVVPLGTIVDATKGTAVVTWARPDGSTYSARFWAGVFEIKQTTGSNPIGEVKLRDDLVGKAASARASTAAGISSAAAQFEAWIAKKKKKGKRKNKVWGDGKGKFRSSGSNSSASVRGTRWLVENFQNATRTYVRSGIVDVRDFKRRKTIRLRKGKSYIAYRR